MSYNIENLSFTIFGSGHDSTRNDSGNGMTSFLYRCDYAAFDSTNRYMWVVTVSGTQDERKIRKIDTTTWQEVPHAFQNINGVDVHFLAYIENTNSNLGILATTLLRTIVFDLTTDEIVTEIHNTIWRIERGYYPRATLSGDVIRIVGTSMDESTKWRAPYVTINLANETMAQNNQDGGWTISSFYNDTDVTLARRNYGDRKALWGVTINDGASVTQQWSNFYIYNDDITLDSFAKDNYLYIPTKVGDIWRFGKYSVPPDFSSPDDYIGINANTLVSPPTYTRGKTWASFLMSDGSLAVTDFVNYGILYTGNNPSLTPIAMGDPYIVCAGSDGYTYLARYK